MSLETLLLVKRVFASFFTQSYLDLIDCFDGRALDEGAFVNVTIDEELVAERVLGGLCLIFNKRLQTFLNSASLHT